MRNAGIALSGSGMQLQSQMMELNQANQMTDQTRREKGWPCDELETRKRAFQADWSTKCQDIEGDRRICCAEAGRARQLKEGRESLYIETAYGSDSGIVRQGEFRK